MQKKWEWINPTEGVPMTTQEYRKQTGADLTEEVKLRMCTLLFGHKDYPEYTQTVVFHPPKSWDDKNEIELLKRTMHSLRYKTIGSDKKRREVVEAADSCISVDHSHHSSRGAPLNNTGGDDTLGICGEVTPNTPIPH
jgi:hypothetical protein